MGNGEKILVVDDVAEQRNIAEGLLTKLGYSVQTAPDGETAASRCDDEPFDLVVLDMIMTPGIDGLDTYLKILQSTPDQKAVIASGYSETERVRRAQQIGAAAYVQKPYTIEQLGAAVRLALDTPFKGEPSS